MRGGGRHRFDLDGNAVEDGGTDDGFNEVVVSDVVDAGGGEGGCVMEGGAGDIVAVAVGEGHDAWGDGVGDEDGGGELACGAGDLDTYAVG